MTTSSSPTFSGQRTIHGVLRDRVAVYGERTFLFYKDRSFTYGDLDRSSDRAAKALQELGVGKGDNVALMLGNRPEFLFLWFGLSKIGGVEVPINTGHRGSILQYMIDKAECRVLFVEADLLPHVAAVIEGLPRLATIVILDGVPDTGVPGNRSCRSFETVMDNDGAFQPVDVSPGDPFVVLFTSGTTGPSKGSVMPQNYALHTGEIIARTAGYGEADRLYNALPLFHGNAQLLSTMPALMSGATMVLAEKFSASRFWDDVRQFQCTAFNYIGSILSILMKADLTPDDAANPLRLMLGAGAQPGLFEAFEKRFGVVLIEGYGMSEVGLPLMSTMEVRRPGSCGKPHPDYEVILVDGDGAPVGPNTPGEAWIRPRKPWSMLLGYYGMPEKTVEAWQNLWFHTGDYLQRDDDGFFHFVDRKKDAIRRRGENISSFEVERIVLGHPKVLECAAVPARSELGEDEVMICVVRRAEAALTAEELVEFCSGEMAAFMVPRYIRFLDRLPKTPTERVEKYKLREDGVTADCWDREAAPGGGRK